MMSPDEYFAEAEKKFGPDQENWAFVCPVCGHRQTVLDYKNAGAPEGAIAFSCVGRWLPNPRKAFGGTGPGPCDYTGGGLFGLNPVELAGRANRYFELAAA